MKATKPEPTRCIHDECLCNKEGYCSKCLVRIGNYETYTCISKGEK
ncbi:MAG: hypothetical protein Q4F05_11415 [bacterium]|nr:hypothetical protein [bacterium]